MVDRRLTIAALVLGLMWATPGRAGVSVNIGIDLPGPPALVPVPGTAVMYDPAVAANYFFYGGQYYAFVGDAWYVSSAYNGPWIVLAPDLVPRPILVVPVRYYRAPPPAWREWRPEAAPRWDRGWGRSWTELHRLLRTGHHERR